MTFTAYILTDLRYLTVYVPHKCGDLLELFQVHHTMTLQASHTSPSNPHLPDTRVAPKAKALKSNLKDLKGYAWLC